MTPRDTVCFIGRIDSLPVVTSTTANRTLTVLCVTTSSLPVKVDDVPPADAAQHRVVVWDESPDAASSRALAVGDRVLIQGFPAGAWKDGGMDPHVPSEYVALRVRRLPDETRATAAPSRAQLRRQIFLAARSRYRCHPS